MRIEDMSTNQKTVLFLVLSAAWVGVLWYFYGRGPEEERAVVAKLRNAKSISIEARGQRGESAPEELTGDREGLVRAFRVLGRYPTVPGAQLAVPIYDLNDSADGFILWLFPPDMVHIAGTPYKIDPGFWPAVLERAPKTKAWLDNAPKERPRPPGKGRPKAPAGARPLAKKPESDAAPKNAEPKAASKDEEKKPASKDAEKKPPSEDAEKKPVAKK